MISRNKVLFLHGWFSTGESKESYLLSLGYKVKKPSLSNFSFQDALEQAQKDYDEFKPHVIVGSSRGGAVALNLKSDDTPLILLAPAWSRFGKVKEISKSNVVIIHSEHDNMVDFNDSVDLVNNSKVPVQLIKTGEDHQLNCFKARNALKKALFSFT
jgi:hypothetical protein